MIADSKCCHYGTRVKLLLLVKTPISNRTDNSMSAQRAHDPFLRGASLPSGHALGNWKFGYVFKGAGASVEVMSLTESRVTFVELKKKKSNKGKKLKIVLVYFGGHHNTVEFHKFSLG